jgi:hypothetical protein
VLQEQLTAVSLRERQLRAITLADTALEHKTRHLDRILQDAAISSHVREAVAAATLREQPFPYAVVDDFLPDSFYNALVDGLPPPELFADRAVNKQQLVVPFELAPSYARRVWRYMAEVAAPEIIASAVIAKFRRPASAWLTHNFPALGGEPLDAMTLTCSDGRILLRRPGYHIRPHRDPKWGFITCLMYLARPGDDERWGTQLYWVEGDEEASGARPHWIDEAQCHPAEHVAFRRNRALLLLNSAGAHSAHIPADAQPQDLERYAYQFRIGAGGETIRRLLEGLPPERRALWEGKVS